MNPWKTHSREIILNRQPRLSVETRKVELPDGSQNEDWLWLDSPEYVVVTAVDGSGQFITLEQHPYAARGPLFAPVEGVIRAGEEALPAAQRLLLQQAGYNSPDWVFLGDFITDAQSGYGRGYYFLARLAAPAPSGADPRVRLLSRQQLEDAVADGLPRVLTWQTGFSLALLRLFAH
ncbi:MAG: NUDIX hydrolase [Chloroflexi bacterium]|jgi:hypothetical protein|nr:hypothetical protein [Anaerolineaceae bacterium]NLI44768.1 NUDIX hydrolase [Chloroflexota bacterium]HOE35222.1 hypothetical protein [Anaerolineaceae bacterium]HOT25554.1 hypothetical protein [Anaerolineaceae bacterium]HQK03446.1 hypothetical protein [Anaerolineaceae bacterium]